MSLDSVTLQQQRLLPASLEDRLFGFFGRIAGCALIALVVAGWLALLTWSVTDPSLSHATSGITQNLLGPIGAVLSDLCLQTLGLSSAFAMLSPMFWGLELVLRQRVNDYRTKLLLFPIAVLLIAGALAALPTSASWPLHHGFGGILGDVLYSLANNLLSTLNADRASAVAGLMFFATGFAAQARCLGHDIKDLIDIVRPEQRSAWQRAEQQGSRGLFAGILQRWRRKTEGEPDPGFRPSVGDGYWGGEVEQPPRPAKRSGHEVDPAPQRLEPKFSTGALGDIRQQAPEMAMDGMAIGGMARSESTFDAKTDVESRAIAERFAPRLVEEHQLQAATVSKKASRFLGGLTRRAVQAYRKPSLNALRRPTASKPTLELAQTVLRGSAGLLEDVLADFGIKGAIKDIRPGPVVTLFELEPARGTKSARVIGLADDIARSMSAAAARVAIVPGRNVIGIELPNVRRETVLLREILESDVFHTASAALPLALGKGIGGEAIVTDLARMPHLLVAGTTGSGKSVGINAFILSLLYKVTPEECRFLMIDPKMLELSVYNGIPHLLCPVVTEPQKAVAALNWAVAEMEERYKRMSKLSVRNIDVYNNRVRNALKRGEALARTVHTGFDQATGQATYEREDMALETMPYIVIVVDEFADLMIVAGKEIEAAVQRLAQMARAAGIHLIMATQRPSVDIITGTIKANFPTRISFKVASRIDSRTILNEQGAEQLLGQGDMLFSSGSGQVVRVHGAFVADEEVEAIARYLRDQGEPRYVEGITDGVFAGEVALTRRASGNGGDANEDIYDKAVATVLRDRKASISYLQRRLTIGYNRAASLMERMEQDGIVGPANSVGKREILAGNAGASVDAA